MNRALASCAGACTLLIAANGGAQAPREARLEYARARGAEHCPDEDSLRGAVSTRLGYDPFRADAPRTIAASISRVGRALRAEIKLMDASGHVTGARELTSSLDDCSELVGAVSLAISIAVDPQSELRGPLPADPPPAPPADPPAPTPPDPTPPPSEPRAAPAPPPRPRPPQRPLVPAPDATLQPPNHSDRIGAHAGLGAFVAVGTAPAVSVGLSTHAGLRKGRISLSLEGRLDLPATLQSGDGGFVSAALVLGTLVPCYHREALLLCGLASAGVMLGEGEGVEETREAVTPFAAAGGRLGVQLFKAGPISGRLFVDVTATLTPTSLVLNAIEVWRTPPVGAAMGIAGLAHFL